MPAERCLALGSRRVLCALVWPLSTVGSGMEKGGQEPEGTRVCERDRL